MPRLRILATSILFQAPNNSVNRLGIKCVSSERYFTTKTRSIFTHNAGSAATTSIIASRLLPSSLFPKVNLSSRVFSVVPSSANFSSCTSSSALCTTLQSWTNGGATNIRLHPRPLLPRLVNVTPFCRSLHTEVDAELSRFLEKEIKLGQNTKKYPTKLPVIQGFDIVTDNAKVTLTKNLGNETITVNLNINHSVDADENEMLTDQKDDDVTQMVSRPPFTVEINQGEKEIFALQCSFPSAEFDDDPSGKDEENMVDLFQIDEVTIHEGDWNEKMYSLGAETMDGNLYDLLMDMLDERGINDEFINQLMDFCTVYEHKRYLSFLDGIKKFVDKK